METCERALSANSSQAASTEQAQDEDQGQDQDDKVVQETAASGNVQDMDQDQDDKVVKETTAPGNVQDMDQDQDDKVVKETAASGSVHCGTGNLQDMDQDQDDKVVKETTASGNVQYGTGPIEETFLRRRKSSMFLAAPRKANNQNTPVPQLPVSSLRRASSSWEETPMSQPTCIRPRALHFSPAWGGWQMCPQDDDGSPHPTILFDIDETPGSDNRKRQKVGSPNHVTLSGIVSSARRPSEPFRRPSGEFAGSVEVVMSELLS